MRICVYAEHTTLAGRVYTGDDIESNDDIECYERESRIGLIIMAAEWASRSGAANAHTIRCGRNILDHLDVVEEDIAMGIIDDLELEIGTADLAWCRLAMDLADGDHLTPDAMQRLSSDPRRHTETDLRSALIMLGCTLATSTRSGEPDYPQPSEPATAPTHASDAVERAGDDQ